MYELTLVEQLLSTTFLISIIFDKVLYLVKMGPIFESLHFLLFTMYQNFHENLDFLCKNLMIFLHPLFQNLTIKVTHTKQFLVPIMRTGGKVYEKVILMRNQKTIN